MAITYLVDLACRVKPHVRASKMLRLLYQRDRANEALNKARRKDPGVPADGVRVNLTVKDRAGKASLAVTTAAEILARFEELDRHAPLCEQCPARVGAHAFGCRGEIHLPISLRGEAWLMGLIHGAAEDPTPKLLLNYLASNGVVGHRVAEMRRVPDIFFESRKALTRRYGSGGKLSVNQVFELLFMTETISARHARFLLGVFDLYAAGLPLDRPISDFADLRVFEHREGDRPVARNGLRAVSQRDDDATIREYKAFFQAMFLACELGCDLKVSL
ncbi:hypothetical protein EDM80_10495 [bacterium]|nr:MAG: hypothetical protein EDM80_10495 [bacterium]RIK64070.1 MAG: hypothetical protein DCC64_04990 [Planctomycetota bacterium]